ncbi:TPA: type I toxin-antitoxin system Ibs family toxin [Escherichia coli]|uniref:Type I toxin-antitoxin system Ibs family toxin n=1 Tax=Escherichia coli TaxID=562 RepID=A0AAN3TSF1_ECOLX|nr:MULTISPECIES: type I toxin-antitoxin system Ibs family toxin [Escherichia]EEZ7665084.1 type I toxin-antitoxin system Ibs family toxin [Escherichia coli]EFB1637784.1 type I toxin-antitoxin system Ibs family toxin [Escherichia coli]EFC0133869.1 type I toxin-antitoxin system Ibs family toxin [Escherichia coli]EFH3098995.1 type I toxin-antitoxin system Ibs family toxin [Escherichia coli]EFH8180824.1 type I toxin-antitoxin system Ibs family toxin [Escherichia coli]
MMKIFIIVVLLVISLPAY